MDAHADPQGFMPTLSRGGTTALDHSASNSKVLTETPPDQDVMLQEEEGLCTHDTAGLHVDVPLFADLRVSLSPETLCNVSVPQRIQRAMQDSSFSVLGQGQFDAIPSQIVELEQPNFLEGIGSRFEDVFAEASSWMKLGEIKYFYMRRHKRLKQCSAPPDESLPIGDQKPFVASEKPDEMPTREQVDDNDMCPLNVSSSLEDQNLTLDNMDPSTPSLDSSESDLLQLKQAKKSANQARQTARWARELMQLVGNGHLFKEESTEVDDRDLSNCKRKRRRLQNFSNSINNESENLGVKERTATQNATVLHKEPQRKWRNVDLSSTDPTQLIGCKCKVFWPDDKVWYTGVINGYNSEAGIHHVLYDDGDKEDLILAKELVKLYVSDDDVITRKLLIKCETDEQKRLDFQEMAALATVFEDFQEEFRHGELVWAKIKGISTEQSFEL